MSKIWLLTKVLFKSSYFGGEQKKKKNSKSSIFGIIILFGFVILGIGIPVIYFIDSLLEVMPIENILISFTLPIAGITSIIFAIFSVVSIFYLNKDSDYLLPLPIDAKDLMISKFFVSLISEYYILLVCIFPFLIGVGIGIDAGIMYYLYTILIFLLIPVIPSMLVTLIILFMGRYTGVFKKKDVFMYISLGLTLVFALGYNYVVQSFMGIDMNNIGSTLGSLEAEVLPYLNKIFPFYNSASKCLMNYNNLNGFFSFITYIAFNLVALLVLYWFGDKLYLKTITTDSGSSTKKEKVEAVLEEKEFKKGSTFAWLLKKEWLIVKRTPVFMLNIVIVVFMVPIIFAISFALSFALEGDVNFLEMSSVDVSMFLNNPVVYCIALLVATFMASVSLAASTSISREGSNAWFMKVIPVSYFKQINVKVFFASLIDFIGTLFVLIFPIIIYRINLLYALSVLIPVTILIVILNYFNIAIDLKKPKLNWTDENIAVKQNMNGMISMMITMVCSVMFGILAYLLYEFDVKINVYLLALIISVIFLGILMLVIRGFKKNEKRLLDMVE